MLIVIKIHDLETLGGVVNYRGCAVDMVIKVCCFLGSDGLL